MHPEKKLKLGWISYLNLFPLFHELKENMSQVFEFSKGTPREVNKKLQENLVDLAPSSSICLLEGRPKEYLPVGVISKGPVLSVYLGFEKEHGKFYQQLLEQIEKAENSFLNSNNLFQNFSSFSQESSSLMIKPPSFSYTTESQTSIELSNILLNTLLGKQSYQEIKRGKKISSSSPVELLIGDKAISQRKQFPFVLDLGEVWTSLTKLPFVYAIWQSNLLINHDIREKLTRITLFTQEKMHQDPEFYISKLQKKMKPKDFSLSEYWRSLFYEIDEKSMEGLKLFLELSKSLSKNMKEEISLQP